MPEIILMIRASCNNLRCLKNPSFVIKICEDYHPSVNYQCSFCGNEMYMERIQCQTL